MKNQKIVSPCISICRTDPRTGYCYGCARTEEEKIIWKKQETSVKWKEENINILIQRMSGWQLETLEKICLPFTIKANEFPSPSSPN